MSGFIDFIKDRLGNIIYPITKEKAVYDDDNIRLDNKLRNIDDKFYNRTTKRYPNLLTEDDINSFYDNFSLLFPNSYEYHGNVAHSYNHSILGGGRYVFDGFKTDEKYEWQRITKYTGSSPWTFIRSKYNDIWSSWAREISTTDIINNDATGGTDKVLSAEAGKVLGQEIDILASRINKGYNGTVQTDYTKTIQENWANFPIGATTGMAYQGSAVGTYICKTNELYGTVLVLSYSVSTPLHCGVINNGIWTWKNVTLS